MSRIALNRINIDRDTKEDEQSIKTVDRYIFYLIIIAIGIIPLLIGMHTSLFSSPQISGTDLIQTGYQSNMFTYYKFIALVTITLISLCLFIFKVLFLAYDLRKGKIIYSIYGFIIFILLSVVFSEYKTIAIWGFYDRNDGAITYICCSLLMIIALNINYPKNALKFVTYALYPFVWVNGIIAVLTFYGHNIVLNSTVQKLLTLFNNQDVPFIEGSILTGTLNQWNYMSGISSFMVMIFLTLAVFGRNIRMQILNFLTAFAAFLTLLVSISSSGFLSFLIMSLFMIVALFLKGPKLKGSIVFILFLAFTSIPLSMFSSHSPAVWDNSFGIFISQNPFSEVEATSLHLDNRAYAADKEFVLPTLPERGTSAGSGRFYIWSTMLELIQNKPLVGYGMDTIAFHFPQNELDKRAGFWDENVIIDKPHNMYLGILWGTGVFGFIAFVVILAFLAVNIIKGVYRKKSKPNPFFIALSMGFGAFLIQAFFNDAVIGLLIAPLLIGTILYASYKYEELVEEIS
ncbi:O-antigen ligase family protein [Psychrobacillus psychrodurans]|uniref:O-antigen ligase family protein n=1 Tax=Psychrobacillus psychrodurans TaxID=126157 RepID=UPI001F4DCD97|nr:O-antigen ligase family protein [Psychrobacillus psychrodurans]MCK1995782.1 O-antigen ligase family protein [Psychrobacillus psychrodurans]